MKGFSVKIYLVTIVGAVLSGIAGGTIVLLFVGEQRDDSAAQVLAPVAAHENPETESGETAAVIALVQDALMEMKLQRSLWVENRHPIEGGASMEPQLEILRKAMSALKEEMRVALMAGASMGHTEPLLRRNLAVDQALVVETIESQEEGGPGIEDMLLLTVAETIELFGYPSNIGPGPSGYDLGLTWTEPTGGFVTCYYKGGYVVGGKARRGSN